MSALTTHNLKVISVCLTTIKLTVLRAGIFNATKDRISATLVGQYECYRISSRDQHQQSLKMLLGGVRENLNLIPLKSASSTGGSRPPSTTQFPGLTWVIIWNWNSIGSAVFAQMWLTHTHTHTHTHSHTMTHLSTGCNQLALQCGLLNMWREVRLVTTDWLKEFNVPLGH